MNPNERNLSLIIGGVVVIAVIVGVVLWKTTANPGSAGSAGKNAGTSAGPLAGPAPSKTVEAVSANTVVPDINSQVAANVAKPSSVSPVVPGSDSDVRGFEMKINGDAFSPDTAIVQVNDVANVKITAVDKTYTIVQPDYGFSLTIPKGETKTLAGQFTAPGKYLLYCPACGGPDKGPRGYIVAVPKK